MAFARVRGFFASRMSVVAAVLGMLALFVLGLGVGQHWDPAAALKEVGGSAPKRAAGDGSDTDAKIPDLGRDHLRDVDAGEDDLVKLSDEAAKLGRDYLIRNTSEIGKLTYRAHPEGRKYALKYNVLRHAGTMYALGMLEQRGLFNDGTKTALNNATKYLLDRYVADVEGQEGVKAVFSKKGEEKSLSNSPEAKLGGAGLAIIGLLEARKQSPELVPLEDLQGLARFILFMMKEDGSFHSKYSADRKFNFAFVSLYYPGEAILGLVRLYHADGDIAWLEAAAKGAGRLVISRRGQKALPPDHWLLIASAELLPEYDKVESPLVEADELYEHVVTIADQMLQAQARTSKVGDKLVNGAFDVDGRCTPAATRLEGLIAVYNYAGKRGDEAVQNRFRPALVKGGEFMLRCQLTSGELKGGVVRAAKAMPGNKAFNRRQREVRVDYVQHAISAWLGIAEICKDGC